MEIEVEENFGWICGAILKKQHDENKRYAELSMDGFRARNKKARTAVWSDPKKLDRLLTIRYEKEFGIAPDSFLLTGF